MGNCCGPVQKKSYLAPPETQPKTQDDFDEEPKIHFKTTISKIKVNGLGVVIFK